MHTSQRARGERVRGLAVRIVALRIHPQVFEHLVELLLLLEGVRHKLLDAPILQVNMPVSAIADFGIVRHHHDGVSLVA